MFNLFRAKCPIDAEAQAWVDARMSWLAAQFGRARVLNTPIIGFDERWFPDPIDDTEPSLRALLDRVCGFMEIPPERVALRLFRDGRTIDLSPGYHVTSREGGAAGVYTLDEDLCKEVIELEVSVPDPVSWIATLAHELAHVHLLGDGRLTIDDEDHEFVTDLTPAVFGLGAFTANAVIRDTQWSDTGWSGWSVGRQGYLDEPTLAYANALIAWARGETKPEWMRHFRPTVRADLKRALRFLHETGETAFELPES